MYRAINPRFHTTDTEQRDVRAGWKPTAHLRFRKRMVPFKGEPPGSGMEIRLLEQLWENTKGETEWRLVPSVDDEPAEPAEPADKR